MSKQYLNRPEQPLEQPLGSRVVLQARVEELEAEVEKLRVVDKMLSATATERDDWCRRTHEAEAKLAGVGKERDALRTAMHNVNREAVSLRASIERARKLAERWEKNAEPSVAVLFGEIARLLSGKAE